MFRFEGSGVLRDLGLRVWVFKGLGFRVWDIRML